MYGFQQPSSTALVREVGTELYYTWVTAYSEAVRAIFTVSIVVQMTVLLQNAVNKSVVDWLPSNYGL